MGLVASAGRVRVDCHLHTVASGDAVLTIEELAERAKQTGLDVVCITDHNVTTAAVQATERDLGVRIIVGEEIRTPDGDVIGLFLTERIPYVLPLVEVIARIKSQHGLVYVPHPFDLARSSLGRVLPGLCADGAVDIIEVFNAKISNPALNRQAADLAARFALPGGAGSDAHDAPGVGAAFLEMPDFDGPTGFLAALADAQLTGEFRDHAVRYPRRSVLPRRVGSSRWEPDSGQRRGRTDRAVTARTTGGVVMSEMTQEDALRLADELVGQALKETEARCRLLAQFIGYCDRAGSHNAAWSDALHELHSLHGRRSGLMHRRDLIQEALDCPVGESPTNTPLPVPPTRTVPQPQHQVQIQARRHRS